MLSAALRDREFRLDVLAGSLVLLTAAITTFLWTHPLVNSFTVQTHGDQAWVQASTQVAMQSGPFATNFHSGAFSGFDPWAFPTSGAIGFYGVAWVLGLVMSSSSNVLALIMAMTAGVVAVSSYAAIRMASARPVHRAVAAMGALALGLSPYVVGKMGHYNVAAFYLLPMLIAVLAYLQRDRTRRAYVIALAVVAIAALISPLWWSLVGLYFLALGLVVALIMRNRQWIVRTAVVLGAVLLGALLPVILSLTHRVGTWNRVPWDSTIYSGSLTDFLVGSPFLTSLVPRLESVLPGTSRELSAVGLLPSAAAIVAIAISLTAYLRYGSADRKSIGWLFVLLQMTLLTFVTLGLGTTQEAVFSLLGLESPLRVWSRLTILVALIGVILVSPWISDRITSRTGRARIAAVALLVAASMTIIVLDVRSIVVQQPSRAIPTLEEVPAVDYLSTAVGDCPVAQLPAGTFPDFPLADGTTRAIDFYYRGFVPYILKPSAAWSYGAAEGSESDALMRSLPADLTAWDMNRLREAGYCAVLYDTEYADWLRAANRGWPGQNADALTPDWSGQRFDVFLLTG